MKRISLCTAYMSTYASERTLRRRGYTKIWKKSLKNFTEKSHSKAYGDTIISHDPELNSQVTGKLTQQRYAGATVFSNQYSELIASTRLKEPAFKNNVG